MMKDIIEAAIRDVVRKAINQVGISGLRATSMFPSSEKKSDRLAA